MGRDTSTLHMTCIAQSLRGLTHFRSNADDIDALADERDALRAALVKIEAIPGEAGRIASAALAGGVPTDAMQALADLGQEWDKG